MSLAVCETGWSPRSRWHLRPLTEAGLKFGGGADTESLCGIPVRWDIDVAVDHPGVDCEECKRLAAVSVLGADTPGDTK